MSALYTSYETSLRLKEAGAPQDHVGTRHWCPESKTLEFHYTCYMLPSLPKDEHPCAFRADAIIEALGPCLKVIHFLPDRHCAAPATTRRNPPNQCPRTLPSASQSTFDVGPGRNELQRNSSKVSR